MSKSIYEVALNILIDSLLDPQDEDDDCYMLSLYQMNEISEAIRMAQKQEKLLKLYRKLSVIRNKIISLALSDADYGDMETIEIDLEKQIKEIENDIR